jgi:hypothetical protein
MARAVLTRILFALIKYVRSSVQKQQSQLAKPILNYTTCAAATLLAHPDVLDNMYLQTTDSVHCTVHKTHAYPSKS